MMKNRHHNLIHQLSETMDSWWRMNQYIQDAENDNCREEIDFWGKYRETLSEQVKMLKERLEEVVKKEGLDIGG